MLTSTIDLVLAGGACGSALLRCDALTPHPLLPVQQVSDNDAPCRGVRSPFVEQRLSRVSLTPVSYPALVCLPVTNDDNDAHSGAEAIDNAIKIARSYTGRQNIITFDVRVGQ